jgi:glycosyltransferase involved in cell wall biosynthesis
MMWPNTIIAILAHRLARSRARLTVSDHTHYSQHFAHSSHAGERRRFRWATRLLYPLADGRIACSPAAADDLAALSKVPRRDFEVIYSPISPPPELPRRDAAERLWGHATTKVLNIGSLNPVKNQALLIRAFARLPDKTAILTILGEGAERTRLEALARELGVAERVRMPGYVIDPWPYLVSADLFALTSNYEGSPLALAEAMHAGLKIVSTDCVSGPRDLLDGGRLGGLVPCNDEKAFADAMAAALVGNADPVAMRAHVSKLAGQGSVSAYSAFVTGT